MRQSSIIIGVLLATLLGSNAFWVYRIIDAGITATYQGVSFNDSQIALRQSIALLNTVGIHAVPQSHVVQAAQQAGDGGTPFEKEGFVWVGRLGLAFNGSGNLVKVVTSAQDK